MTTTSHEESGSLFEEPLPQQSPGRQRRPPSPLQVTLADMDWALYEQNVHTLLTEAIPPVFQAHGGERLCQMSVLTRPQNGQSVVSFKTAKHAADYIERYHPQTPDQSSHPMQSLAYNESPCDFAYWEWASLQHAELQPLCSFTRDGRMLAIERRLFTSLKVVVKRLIRENTLSDLPLSRPFFIGASSAKDWFEIVAVLR